MRQARTINAAARHLGRWVSAALLLACSGVALAQLESRYVLTLLTPVDGSFDSTGAAVSDAGLVAGTSGSGEAGPNQATRWRRGVPTSLPGLGEVGSSSVQGVNARGWSVGDSVAPGGLSRATLWKVDGEPIDLGTLGGPGGIALAINAHGVVVGFSNFDPDDPNNSHATRWDGTGATDLGTLGGTFSGAYAINGHGLIAGSSVTAGNREVHAVLWAEGAIVDLGLGYAFGLNDLGDAVGSNGEQAVWWPAGGAPGVILPTLGGSLGQASDINGAQQIVGWSMLPGNVATHAVLWQGGTVTDLNRFVDAPTRAAGWVLGSAVALNERGWIVGTATNTSNAGRLGYLLRPRAAAR